jgi:hypothetical protein
VIPIRREAAAQSFPRTMEPRLEGAYISSDDRGRLIQRQFFEFA